MWRSAAPMWVMLVACASESGLQVAPLDPPAPPDSADTSVPHTADTEVLGDDERPIAVCEVSPKVVETLDLITFDASQSYDPYGHPITAWDWTLVGKPQGSDTELSSGNASRTARADLAGEYTARLQVYTDDRRTSLPCETTSLAIPSEDLWVEMFWTHDDDDMDLHLLGPGGEPRTNGDCHFANCRGDGLDWGGPSHDDDPALDIDDIPGVGPENINIEAPADGTYTVFVDDYTGSTVDWTGSNEVTVNIYVVGILAWTDTRDLSGEGSDVYFAEVDWPGGAIRAR